MRTFEDWLSLRVSPSDPSGLAYDIVEFMEYAAEMGGDVHFGLQMWRETKIIVSSQLFVTIGS